ncbi:MAG: hypothetical protein ACXW1S_04845 [Acidimicrobiia bacterium]
MDDPFGDGPRDALEERLFETLTAFMDDWVVPIMDRAPAFGETRRSVVERFATVLHGFADGLEGP